MVPDTTTQIMQTSTPSKKRKRTSAEGSSDTTSSKNASTVNGSHVNGGTDPITDDAANGFTQQLQETAPREMSTTAAAALSAELETPNNQNLSFVSTDQDRPATSFDSGDNQMAYGAAQYAPGAVVGGQKPVVGTDEWHKVRRDNHKEVERRRRETINEGINELAKIVPGCEKNKGSILARAVTYINDLKARDSVTVEKKVLEKVVLEQAVNELQEVNNSLQQKLREQMEENDRLREKVRILEGGAGGDGNGE